MANDLALTNQPVQFDEQGKPFWPTQSGGRSYVPPISAGTMVRNDPNADPRLVAFVQQNGVTAEDPNGNYGDKSSSYLHGQPYWNGKTGGYDQNINWSNLLSTGLAAAGTAGLATAAMGAGGAAGAASGGGAAAGSGAATGSGLLASSAIPTASLMGGPAAASSGLLASGAATSALGGASGSGMMGSLSSLARSPEAYKAGANMLASGAETMANNRSASLDAATNQERLRQNQFGLDTQRQNSMFDELVARSQEGRASGTDAWKKMQYGDYVANGGSEYKPANGLPSYGFGPHASTDVEKQGAEALRAEAMQRLQGGNPIDIPAYPTTTPFTYDPKLTKGSTAEKLMGYGSAALGTWGALSRFV
jgi:hypothetical protein